MAIDTKQKRASIFQGLPWMPRTVFPDGVIANTDREIVSGLYGGIAPAQPSAFVPITAETITLNLHLTKSRVIYRNIDCGRVFNIER